VDTIISAFQLDGREYVFHEVVQKPIDPPYKEALEKMKTVNLRDNAIVVDTSEELEK
jgi:hypothetical protein